MDVNYCAKIHNEKDFDKIRPYIKGLEIELRDEQKQKSLDKHSVIIKKHTALNDLYDELKNQEAIEIHDEEIKNCIMRITELIQRNSYLDYLEANAFLDKSGIMIQKLCDDTKVLLEKTIGYYNSNIGGMKYNMKQRTDERLKKLNLVWWIGIPISILLAISGCVYTTLGNSIFILVVVYFALRSIFK